jgi:molybdenum cofactor guanylyltransferase
MILGCVLAGGQSRRFGSDKALAQLDGQTLLERAVEQISRWCASVVVVGRETAPAPCLADWPAPNRGPLGGIAAALRLARERGDHAVLTVAVDSVDLPDDLPDLLTPAPAYLVSQPVVGLWPVARVDTLEAMLTGPGKCSMLVFAEAIGARGVKLAAEPANINTLDDLDALQQRFVETRRDL